MNLDAALGVAILNFLSLIANLYWTIRLKNIQGNGELMKTLISQNQAQDLIIKSLELEKVSLKKRYSNLLREHQEISK